ncbi:nucleotidyl transferase AbiEii/AbiGii toxin family protein [Mycoplasma procyoni]|uniref:nucleotidyl transferase AbiEii/AbiGii toxin family protein n=1 Tax=Mycoplasma procyoni TaxID=568784 RepID=UPI00197B1C0C|nr:nucleotidyl transferase AbiEii/AbiGii toxin family protein [Mycoplasma procyoni]MBN3534729.1 nucleotidyl transferase AbiEii/AbiGii toxin family protein [Mycoplasma procyoni]
MNKEILNNKQKEEFIDYVIYKIFSNKTYRNSFVLEGSLSLKLQGLKVEKIFYRLPKDMDLNLVTIKDFQKKMINVLQEVFQDDKDIKIELKGQFAENNTEKWNNFIIKNSKSNLSIDLIKEQEIFDKKDVEFLTYKGLVKVNVYDIEKQFVSKLEQFIKNNDIKYFLDLCWILNSFDINDNKVILYINKIIYKTFSLKELENFISNFETNTKENLTFNIWEKHLTNNKIDFWTNTEEVYNLQVFKFLDYLKSIILKLKKENNNA